jgi:hypothetical protein
LVHGPKCIRKQPTTLATSASLQLPERSVLVAWCAVTQLLSPVSDDAFLSLLWWQLLHAVEGTAELESSTATGTEIRMRYAEL